MKVSDILAKVSPLADGLRLLSEQNVATGVQLAKAKDEIIAAATDKDVELPQEVTDKLEQLAQIGLTLKGQGDALKNAAQSLDDLNDDKPVAPPVEPPAEPPAPPA